MGLREVTERPSCSSVQKYLAPLSEMFNHAVEDGLIERSPCLRVLRSNRGETDHQTTSDFYTREEVTILLDTCREHFPQAYAFVLVLVRAGLRVGEAVALQWGDVDFQGRFLHVQRNYVDGHIYSPKSGRSRRVDMSQHLSETLRTLRGRRKEETLRRGWQGLPDWVFTTEAGTHLDPDNFRVRVWAKIPTRGGCT